MLFKILRTYSQFLISGVCTTLVLAISFNGFSQSSEQILLQKLRKTSGKEKVILYYKLSEIHAVSDTEKATEYCDKGIKLSNEIDYELGKTKGILYEANINTQIRKYGEAIDKYLQVLYSGEKISKGDSVHVLGGLGTALGEIGAYELAIDFRKKLLAMRNLKTGPDVYYPFDNIAYSYLRLKEYDSANVYYGKARIIAEEMNDPTTRIHCYNNIGFGYFKQGKVTKAIDYYSHGLETFEARIAPKFRDSVLYGMLHRNMALAKKELGEFSEGIESMMSSTEIFDQISDSSYLPRNLILSAELQVILGDYPLALENLNHAKRIIKLDIDKLDYLRILSDYYSSKNQNDLALDVLKEYVSLKEELAYTELRNAKITDVLEFNTDRIRSELALQQKLRENEKEIGVLEKRLIIGGSSMLFIIFIILFLKYKSSRKKKEQLMEAESQLNLEQLKTKEIERKRLEEELRYKNGDLTDFAIDSTKKHEFIEEILTQLNNFKNAQNFDAKELQRTIQLVKAQHSIDENIKLFQDNVDQINHEFMDKLEVQFPELTKSEKQMCALLRLQLSSKEIATIKNISTDSVKTLRYRLRKKLNLSPEDRLSDFLSKI